MDPTSDELRGMADHVEYEVLEFRKAIATLPDIRKSAAQWNGTIESALLHFRILRAFFFAEKGDNDDVFAKHYVAGWNPTPERVFGETRADINKRLAHLSTRRLTEFSWPMNEMNSAIENLVAEFCGRLSTSQGEWFSRLLDKPIVALLTGENYSTTSQAASSTGTPTARRFGL